MTDNDIEFAKSYDDDELIEMVCSMAVLISPDGDSAAKDNPRAYGHFQACKAELMRRLDKAKTLEMM